MGPIRRSVAIILMGLLWCSAAGAQETADFKGKTTTLVVGFESGGSYDIYGRLFARFLSTHLPGRPNVVVQNMPGAGGLVAANYLYNVARRDGTVVGVISQTAGIGQVLETPGIRYDVRKFVWIGRLVSNSQVLHAWYTAGIKTMADTLTHELVVAGTGPTSSSVVFPHIMNDLLGTKFKDVLGYNGPTSATVAMERGESRRSFGHGPRSRQRIPIGCVTRKFISWFSSHWPPIEKSPMCLPSSTLPTIKSSVS